MKSLYAIAAFAVSTIAANADVIATTGFETSDNFVALGIGAYQVDVVAADGAHWQTGGGTINSVWNATAKTGSLSAVIGNQPGSPTWMTVDPAGADGVETVVFEWDEYSGSTNGTFDVQWTTDALDGNETWTTAATITQDTGLLTWTSTEVTINQPGDVKIRWVMNGTRGSSIDDVVITSYSKGTVIMMSSVGGWMLLLLGCLCLQKVKRSRNCK
jgi:hypothetical protein